MVGQIHPPTIDTLVTGMVEVTLNMAKQLAVSQEDLKMIFLTETKCKIRFIYVGVNCKRKKWGKKMSGNYDHQGGPTPNGENHLKFPF